MSERIHTLSPSPPANRPTSSRARSVGSSTLSFLRHLLRVGVQRLGRVADETMRARLGDAVLLGDRQLRGFEQFLVHAQKYACEVLERAQRAPPVRIVRMRSTCEAEASELAHALPRARARLHERGGLGSRPLGAGLSDDTAGGPHLRWRRVGTVGSGRRRARPLRLAGRAPSLDVESASPEDVALKQAFSRVGFRSASRRGVARRERRTARRAIDARSISRPPDQLPADRWLTPGVGGIGTASFLADLGHEIPTALLPSFLTSTLGAPAAALGAIEGIADGLAGVGRFAAARSPTIPSVDARPRSVATPRPPCCRR